MSNVIQFPKKAGAPLPAVKTSSDPSGIEEAFVSQPHPADVLLSRSVAQSEKFENQQLRKDLQEQSADLIRLAELNHEMKNLLKKILKQAKLR